MLQLEMYMQSRPTLYRKLSLTKWTLTNSEYNDGVAEIEEKKEEDEDQEEEDREMKEEVEESEKEKENAKTTKEKGRINKNHPPKAIHAVETEGGVEDLMDFDSVEDIDADDVWERGYKIYRDLEPLIFQYVKYRYTAIPSRLLTLQKEARKPSGNR